MTGETKNCPYCGEEILAEAIKCKHCKEMLNNFKNSNNTSEDIVIKTKEMNFLQKLASNYWIVKSCILKEFSYQNGYIELVCCSGKHIEGNTSELEITLFNDSTYGRTIEIKKSQQEKLKFFIDSCVLSDKESEQIFKLLQPKETKLSKTLGLLGTILEIFS